MFNNRFSFRRKNSKDVDAEALERPPPPPYRNTDQPTSSSHQLQDAQVQRSHTTISALDLPTVRSKSPAGTRDPLGLRVLYNPQGNRRVDIIFVHGLGGTSRLTWSKNKDLGLFWPLEFLPLEPDICEGRIMTFGYNSSFLKANTRNSATVLDFAKDLLYELKYAQDEDGEDLKTGSVPIVFLVHSMGGLIIKEAYMQGQYDPEYKEIVNAISAIIFLSTPHRGTNLADTLNRILQASVISSSKQFISELTKNSFTLQRLNEQFRHVAPKLDIVSFYETQMTPIGISKNKIMVLERDSSVLGYPGEISKAMDADHHGVCKYDSPEDPLYVSVRNVLKSLISKFPPPGSTTSTSASRRQELREIESFLAVSDAPDADYVFFRDQWVPHTCDWILEDKAVVEWMHSRTGTAKILWLYGPAASGKSVLSSFVIDHLAQMGLPCHYFFVRFGDQRKRSVAMLLRSLALQVAQSLPGFRQGILRLVEKATNLDNADAQTIWNRVFKSVLLKSRHHVPLYWVLDGLDESDDPRLLLKLLADVENSLMPVRILIVSRRTQELVLSFQRLSNAVQLDMVFFESNPHDIRSFIQQELDVSGDDDFQLYVKQQILARARGNFLWVNLAVQKINNCHTEADVDDALQELPSGMQALYDRMASSVATLQQREDQKLALSILSWVTCAQRSLTLEELLLVLEKEISKPLDLQRSLGDLCGGFVILDNDGNTAMIHQTAREYLVGDMSRPFNIDPSSAHERLLLRCMDCLTDFGLRSKLNRKQPPKILHYAASSWVHHLSGSSVDSAQIRATLKTFFNTPSVLTWIQALAQANQLRSLVLASTHLLAFVNRRRKTISDKLAPEDELLEMWSTDLVKIVGKFGSNLLRNPESIYKLIPPFCPDNSIIYKRFGKKESNNIKVSGHSGSDWDDSLARLSFGVNIHATWIQTAGGRIAVLSPTGIVLLYYASTCEENRRIKHGERVLKIHLNLAGTLLVTYGYLTTKVWDLPTGRCVLSTPNPVDRPRPHTIIVTEDDDQILVGFDDHKVRSLALGEHSPAWTTIAHIDEQAFEGTIVNSPHCMALSPDGAHIALGYRGHPLCVWEVQGPELVGHCMRVFDDTTQSHASHAWGKVIHVTWHPYNGEVIGLYIEGVVFRWHPYHDETQEISTGANSISVSQDAKCLATGDPNGIIKLYSLADFSLVYQFASQDPVFDLCFAPDSRRLYDVRGSYANVWEPAALLRLSEATDNSARSTTEAEILVHHTFGKIDPVMALSTPLNGNTFCSGTESGVVKVCGPSHDRNLELRKSQSFNSIEHIAWSDDGKYVAFTDLSSRLFVRLLRPSNEGAGQWKIEAKLDVTVSGGQGPIAQILFHPKSDRLLLYMGSSVRTISLASGETIEIKDVPAGGNNLRWLNHPSHKDSLIAVGPGIMLIWAWTGLIHAAQMSFPIASADQIDRLSRSRMSSSTNLWEIRECIDRVLVTVEKTHLLVQTSFPSIQGQKLKEIAVFDASKIPTANSPTNSTHILQKAGPTSPPTSPTLTNPTELTPLLLPAPLLAEVDHPLTFLSRDRLVFLDHNSWLCSWRLPLYSTSGGGTSPSTSRRPSAPGSLDASTTEIVRHFFLPGDWISPDAVALCTVMADGTVLCPRNGDVAVVKCASLRV